VIDECHRGSAAEDANWRQILEYFNGATQIGLTATPKETKDVSNIEYFWRTGQWKRWLAPRTYTARTRWFSPGGLAFSSLDLIGRARF
jgi:superfamily II DNA or RNA helicase